MANIFERASKKRLRFPTEIGNLTVEDLWLADLNQLDKLAVALQEELERSTNKSFLEPKRNDVDLKLRFEIAKSIIESRLADIEKTKSAAKTKAKNQLIMQIIEQKENQELLETPIEELREMMQEESDD